jgi:hypothetical protein
MVSNVSKLKGILKKIPEENRKPLPPLVRAWTYMPDFFVPLRSLADFM